MKKIEFNIDSIHGLYNVETEGGGLGEATYLTAITFGVSDDTDEDTYGFDECYAKACTKFKEVTHLTYVPTDYVDLLTGDTLQAMADSIRNDYEDAMMQRIARIAIEAVIDESSAPCKVKRAYFTNNVDEECSVWEATSVVAEVTEKEAHEFAKRSKADSNCDTLVEWHEWHCIEDELKEAWDITPNILGVLGALWERNKWFRCLL